MEELKEQLMRIYDQFMTDMQIDKATGRITVDEKGTEWRFGTMPFIGAKYYAAKRKILFLGMDIGEDINEEKNTYLDFDSRHDTISKTDKDFKNGPNYNPHIAGTYAIALAILSQYNNQWQITWDTLSQNVDALNKIAIDENCNILPIDVMEYVGLTNIFKFVTVGRHNLSGDINRRWINKEIELKLLKQEIDAYNPDVVILQGGGRYLPQSIFDYIQGKGIILLNCNHPAAWRNGENKIAGTLSILNEYNRVKSS